VKDLGLTCHWLGFGTGRHISTFWLDLWWAPILALCLYGAGRSHALQLRTMAMLTWTVPNSHKNGAPSCHGLIFQAPKHASALQPQAKSVIYSGYLRHAQIC